MSDRMIFPGLLDTGREEFFHEFLLRMAGTLPDRPAVIEPAGSERYAVTTYRELELLVRDHMAALDGLGLEIGDRVILEADLSAASIAALLACSALGLTFVPVGTRPPEQRLASIMETTEPALYLRCPGAGDADVPLGVGLGHLEGSSLTIERAPADRPRRRREPTVTDPAYVIFTSGTTGRPKGVVMSHRAVTSFYHGMAAQRLVTPDDRVANTSPLQFDFSLINVGLALGSGAALVTVPPESLRWPRRFVRVLKETGATQVNGVPSIWRPVLRHEQRGLADLDRLRGILFCGEDFPLPELRHLRALLPGVRVTNCYGSTESMACSFEEVPNPLPADVKRLSIGFAHKGAEMLLVDEAGRLIERPGLVGEIVLRGPALFTGYWDDPDATRAALLPDPVSPRSGQVVLRTGDLGHTGQRGEMYFCGRADSQVQIRGNRVELDEVRHRLLEFPGVMAAEVLVLDPADGDRRLGAFVVVPARSTDIGTAELRAHCAQALPSYMIPSELRVLDALPTTPNGKTDRESLLALVSG